MRFAPIVVAAVLLTGCYQSSAVGADGSVAASGPPKCPFESGLSYDPSIAYPFCQWEAPDGYERYCAPTVDAWGYSNWHTRDDGSAELCENDSSCDTCMCAVSCDRAPAPGGGETRPCPQPETGTARAECLVWNEGSTRGMCHILCENGDAPEGMRCVWTPATDEREIAARRICAWAVGDEPCSI